MVATLCRRKLIGKGRGVGVRVGLTGQRKRHQMKEGQENQEPPPCLQAYLTLLSTNSVTL